MESFELKKSDVNPEAEAESKLEDILANPKNAFLTEHKMNRDRIDNADSLVEALQIAEGLIMKRLEATYEVKILNVVEGIGRVSIDMKDTQDRIDMIKANQNKIGEGDDAFVVIDKNEIVGFPPEVCYKIAKKRNRPGRNTAFQEAKIHDDFRKVIESNKNLHIDIPEPFYSVMIGSEEMIAMEKLPAKSVKDIFKGEGFLPDWIDADLLCDCLEKSINSLHEENFYHRDLHTGNFMIRQSDSPPEDGTWGYIIDFGYSGYSFDGENPYHKVEGNDVFTGRDDYDIIKEIREFIKNYRDRKEYDHAV